MIRQISSQLLSPTEKLKVQLSVGLIDSSNRPSYCSMYNMGNASYLNITPFTQIVIKYVEKGRPWSKSDNIYINQRNIYGFKVELKMFYDEMMNHADEIYKYGNTGYIVSMGNIEKFKKSIPLGLGQLMSLEPATIYNQQGKPIPGIYMEINQRLNMVELSMEEFESFYDLFSTINIYQSGMTLLQTYMMMGLKSGGLKVPFAGNNSGSGQTVSQKDVQMNIFEKAATRHEGVPESQEMVEGPPITKQPTTLDELG